MHVSLLSLTPGWATANIGAFLLAAMAARGHRTSVLACNGMQHLCMFKWAFLRDGGVTETCQDCMRVNAGTVDLWTIGTTPLRVTSDWLDATADAGWHEAVPADATLDELLAFEWQGLPLGRWVIPALRIEWVGENWWQLPEVQVRARLWLLSAIRAAMTAAWYIAVEKPDVMLIYDGLLPAERAVWAVARQNGVRCVLYGSGQDSEIILLRTDKPVGLYDFGIEWSDWRDEPLTPEEEHRLDAYLAARQGIGGQVESSFSPPRQGRLQELAADMGLHPGVRRVVTALPGVAADYVFDLTDREFFPEGPAFPSTEAWLQEVVAQARRHPEADWVVRGHPAEPGYKGHDKVAEMMARLPDGLPENLRFLPPESPVSTYDLLGLTDLVLVFHSTSGMEAAAMGLPVVSAGQAHYSGAGFVWHTTTAAMCRSTVDRLLAQPECPPDAVALARRYLFFWFLRTDRRAAMFRLQDKRYVRPYQSLMWLSPGRDPVLDGFCHYISGDGPFIGPPSPARWPDASAT